MELSFGEILVILVLAFVVLGPDELIRQSQRMGRFIAKLKTEANNFRVLAEEEVLRAAELKAQLEADLNKVKVGLDQDVQSLVEPQIDDPHLRGKPDSGDGGPKDG